MKHVLEAGKATDCICVEGWVRTRRDAKMFSFLEVNDGTSLASIQVVVDRGVPGYEHISQMGTGAAVRVEGILVESPGGRQKWEIRATQVEEVGVPAHGGPFAPADESIRGHLSHAFACGGGGAPFLP